MKILHRLEKSKDFWFLLIISCIFFLLRLPSLFEPYWYGDEGIYQTMATAINNGSVLYRDIWDNKPPLLYVIYALFQGDQFSLRILSVLFGILSIIVFFFLAKKLFKKTDHTHKGVYIGTVIFSLLFGLPLLEGNIANAENFLLLPIITAALLLISYLEKPTKKRLVYAGIVLSFAFLIKIVAIFDLFAFSIFLFAVQYKNKKMLLSQIKTYIPFLLGFLLPIGLSFLYFALHNSIDAYTSAAFSQNIGYVSYGNSLIIPQGKLYLKIFLLVCFTIFVFSKRNYIKKESLFIYLWLGFSLFSTFFSHRPYTHYILMLLPSFCLFTILIATTIAATKTHHGNKISLRLFAPLLPILIIVLLVYYNFDLYRKNMAYYQNFIQYITNQKTLTDYQSFFDPSMPQWYAVSQFLKTHTDKNDTVFVWSNAGQIYKMSETLPPGKYTVAYHITNSSDTMKETAKALMIKKPRFVVIFPSTNYPFNLSSYRYVYSIQNAQIYESIF